MHVLQTNVQKTDDQPDHIQCCNKGPTLECPDATIALVKDNIHLKGRGDTLQISRCIYTLLHISTLINSCKRSSPLLHHLFHQIKRDIYMSMQYIW